MIKDHGFESVITTRGSEGISVIKKNGKNFHIPSKAKEVFDVSGAGDTVFPILHRELQEMMIFLNRLS